MRHCLSGGRFDPGMLFYSAQIWTSDNTDALTRMKIQYGASLAYPTRSQGAHVSTVPNHITGSTTRLRTRALVAMCGTFGFELDMEMITAKDAVAYRKQIEVYKQVHPVIRWGDQYRLWNPFKVSVVTCLAQCRYLFGWYTVYLLYRLSSSAIHCFIKLTSVAGFVHRSTWLPGCTCPVTRARPWCSRSR
jgi:alpha-galactosidase